MTLLTTSTAEGSERVPRRCPRCKAKVRTFHDGDKIVYECQECLWGEVYWTSP